MGRRNLVRDLCVMNGFDGDSYEQVRLNSLDKGTYVLHMGCWKDVGGSLPLLEDIMVGDAEQA